MRIIHTRAFLERLRIAGYRVYRVRNCPVVDEAAAAVVDSNVVDCHFN